MNIGVECRHLIMYEFEMKKQSKPTGGCILSPLPTKSRAPVHFLLSFCCCCCFIILLFFFHFTILYWFCHTSTCICHGCTHVPYPEPHSHLPPHTIPLGHPSAPAPSFLYPASSFWVTFQWCFSQNNILLGPLSFHKTSGKAYGFLRTQTIEN